MQTSQSSPNMTSMALVPAPKPKKSPIATDSQHLFDALQRGKIHLTRFILAASSNQLQNSWDQEGRTPLIACCDNKEEGTRDQLVHILLEGGADVNMPDREGRTPLIHACEKRCNDIVRILIHHHNIKPDLEDVYGNTALIYSAAVGNDVATELLTRNFRRLGLQVDHYNKQGNTALIVAARNGNINCAKILAQKGRASVILKDKEHGMTAMEWCLKQGYQKDEVDFLKPNQRFYRVAKLATSLSRSRSSMSSITSDPSGKVKFSPAKSGENSGKVRTPHPKASLSRSKSQTVESHSKLGDKSQGQSSAMGIKRQTTVDVAVVKQQIVRQNAASGSSTSYTGPTSGSPPKHANKSEDKNKATRASASHPSSFPAEFPSEANVEMGHHADMPNKDGMLQECINISPVKMANKSHLTGKSHPFVPPVKETTLETSNERPLLGTIEETLGCSLSLSSMATASTASLLGSESSSGTHTSSSDPTLATACSVTQTSSSTPDSAHTTQTLGPSPISSPISPIMISAVSGNTTDWNSCPTLPSHFPDDEPDSLHHDHVTRPKSASSAESTGTSSVTSLSEAANHTPEPGTDTEQVSSKSETDDGQNSAGSVSTTSISSKQNSLSSSGLYPSDNAPVDVDRNRDSTQPRPSSRNSRGGSASFSSQQYRRELDREKYSGSEDAENGQNVANISAPSLSKFVRDSPEPHKDSRIIVTSRGGQEISQDA